MKMKALLVSLAMLAASAAAPAFAAPSPARQCFNTRDVQGFAAQSDDIVNVRVGISDVYQFKLMTRCPDIKWHESLGLVSHGSNFICSGLDADLVSRSGIGPQTCPVSQIHKLTPAEIAALPKGAKP